MSDVQIILQLRHFNRPRSDDARLRHPDTWALSEVNRKTSDKAELSIKISVIFCKFLCK